MRPDDLEPHRNYVFPYPYISTPCFLLDLGRPIVGNTTLETREGRHYQWHGGVGPNSSLVAYSAICSHRLTYPAPSVSFISYQHDDNAAAPGVIHCCSEHSRYAPERGAMVLGGPAPEPLATIALEYDAGRDELRATGAYGGTLFNRFLSEFASRLTLEYEGVGFREQVTGETSVYTLEEYSKVQMHC